MLGQACTGHQNVTWPCARNQTCARKAYIGLVFVSVVRVQDEDEAKRPNFGPRVRPPTEEVYNCQARVNMPFGVTALPPAVFLPLDGHGNPWECHWGHPDGHAVRLRLECEGGLTFKSEWMGMPSQLSLATVWYRTGCGPAPARPVMCPRKLNPMRLVMMHLCTAIAEHVS